MPDRTTSRTAKRRGPLALLIILLVALIAAALIFGPGSSSSRNQQVAGARRSPGLTRAEAEARITNAGLVVGTVSEDSSKDVPIGQVISQNPTDTTQVDRGTTVDFVVSNGKPQVTLPDVVGQDKDQAAASSCAPTGCAWC